MTFARHAFLVWSLTTWSADAVVASDPDDSPRSFVSTNRVPRDLEQLRLTYDHFVTKDKFVNGTYPRAQKAGKVKMLIGVFTMTNTFLWKNDDRESNIRRIIRDTWASHPDVCTWPWRNKPSCTIHLVFVACQGENTEERNPRLKIWNSNKDGYAQEFKRNEPDVLLMPFNERMNEGKTFQWFQLASKFFEDMDYIGKADSDVFLHVNTLIDSLRTPEEIDHQLAALRSGGHDEMRHRCENHGEAFLGKPWTCLGEEWCPPRECGPPVGVDFMAFDTEIEEKDACFTYMQGGFYAMTASTAREISAPGGYFDQHKEGPEDLQTGLAVAEYARRTGHCITVWEKEQIRNDRMYHHLRGKNEHPGRVSDAWDNYYDKKSNWDLEVEGETNDSANGDPALSWRARAKFAWDIAHQDENGRPLRWGPAPSEETPAP